MSDYTTLGGVQLPDDLQWIDEFGDGSDLVAQVQAVTKALHDTPVAACKAASSGLGTSMRRVNGDAAATQ